MFTARVERNQKLDVARIAALLKGPTRVKVGFPAGKARADVVQRAIWNEFGTRGGASGGGWGGPVPERPFMRNAMRANRGKYQRAMSAGAREILRGSTALAGILPKLGILAQGDIQKKNHLARQPAEQPGDHQTEGLVEPADRHGRDEAEGNLEGGRWRLMSPPPSTRG